MPNEPGDYQLEAALCGGARSRCAACAISEWSVAGNTQEDGIARGKPVKASSTYVEPGNDYRPENAVDGLTDTRWSSEFSDPQWLAIDLGTPTRISRVVLDWEMAFGQSYAIQVSLDGSTWTDVYTTERAKAARRTSSSRQLPLAGSAFTGPNEPRRSGIRSGR